MSDKRKATVRILIEVVICLVLLLLMTISLHISPLISGIVAIVCYFGLDLLLSPESRLHLTGPMAKLRETQYQDLLSNARNTLEHINATKLRLKDASICREVNTMLDKMEKIMRYLVQKPERIPMARRLLTYYVDTLDVILAKACEVQEQPGDAAQQILAKVHQSIQTLCQSVDGQMDHLLQSDVMDIDAEIDVMKAMMKLDGLEDAAPFTKEDKP